MVAPVTTVNRQFLFPPGGRPGGRGYYAYIFRVYEKQRKPYNLQLLTTTGYITTTSLIGFDGYSVANGFSSQAQRPWIANDYWDFTNPDSRMSWFRGLHLDAMNVALKRLQAKAYDDKASLGAALGELPETVSMIAKRVEQLAKGFRHLRKLEFYELAVTFGMTRKKRPKKRRAGKSGKLYWSRHPVAKRWYPVPDQRWKHSRSFSALVLEYNFGWAPFVGDIQSALKIISSAPAYETKIRGGGTVSRSSPDFGHVAYYRYSYTHWVKVRAACGGTFRITNPNYDLLDRLGLTNLASVALELTPFSFVANWFINLDEFIGNLSDGYRSSMSGIWHSYRVWSTAFTRQYNPPNIQGGSLILQQGTKADSYRRQPNELPAVSLRVRSRFMPSFTRAANASALLVQLFGGKRIA